MSYQALARKYRPQTFDDILGQDSIVRTLTNSIEDNRIHQAYLFSGVRGVGKTTTARILAKALNCVTGPTVHPCNECTVCREITEGIDLDVREIDAATYTQVDNIRELREVTQFQPARDRNRVFIIDEAHMLSTGAWNALLKLIEEPPPHVVFILATTEMHKVPQTILSRVQQFVFRRITRNELVARLDEVCRAEEIEAEPAALEIVARRGDGSVRDVLSILDQAVAFAGRSLSAADVTTVLGLSDNRFFSSLVREVHAGDSARILEILEEAAESGRDFKLLYRDLLAYMRNLVLLASGAPETMVQIDPEEMATVRDVASLFKPSELLRIVNILVQDDDLVSRSEQQRLAVEIALLKAAMLPSLRSVEEILAGGGTVAPAPKPAESGSRTRGYTARGKAAPQTPARGAAAGDGLAAKIAAEVGQTRKVAASYLGMASATRIDGEELVFEFEAAQAFAVSQLEEPETVRLVTEAASRIAGRTVTARFEIAGANEPAGSNVAANDPVRNDPVIRAFARHLGGEVVPPANRGRKENER